MTGNRGMIRGGPRRRAIDVWKFDSPMVKSIRTIRWIATAVIFLAIVTICFDQAMHGRFALAYNSHMVETFVTSLCIWTVLLCALAFPITAMVKAVVPDQPRTRAPRSSSRRARRRKR